MRSRLCDASVAIFREGGLEAVTFRALADAVGVSHTLPYRYFENKEDLLANVRVLCFERFEAFVRAREAGADGTVARMSSFSDASMRTFWRAMPAISRTPCGPVCTAC